jgi:hypothetical protein
MNGASTPYDLIRVVPEWRKPVGATTHPGDTLDGDTLDGDALDGVAPEQHELGIHVG